MNKLTKYLEDNFIEFEKITDNIVKINDKTYQIVYPNSEGKLFDDSFDMTCDDTEEDNYIFEFGGKWYSSPKGSETDPQLNLVKYLGKANIQPPLIPWLGIHGKYEILNGSRSYDDWCKKAKFLGCTSLGICELNTLAGVLQFQEECKNFKIHSIIGATYVIAKENIDERYKVKVYVKNEEGWDNLLRIHKAINIDNEGFIPETQFLKYLGGLIIILDPKYSSFLQIQIYRSHEVFYQLDTVQFENEEADKEYLSNLKLFIQSSFKPVLIQDSYYLDKEDSHIKTKLNQISGTRELKSKNQYFKAFDEIYDELDSLFSRESETFEKLIEMSVKNLLQIEKSCQFQIDTSKRHLPEYKMTEEESKRFATNRNMLDFLIEKGLQKKIAKKDFDQYRERIKSEIEVIEHGNVVDYFLILWDIIRWCQEQGILVGVGRGSSGGSLVAYLLDITQLDPLKFDLLFERFLNKGRIGKHTYQKILSINDGDIELDFDQNISIFRNSKSLKIKACELQKGDQIIM